MAQNVQETFKTTQTPWERFRMRHKLQNIREYLRTLKERIRTWQNIRECQRTPQNLQERLRIHQSTQECLKMSHNIKEYFRTPHNSWEHFRKPPEIDRKLQNVQESFKTTQTPWERFKMRLKTPERQRTPKNLKWTFTNLQEGLRSLSKARWHFWMFRSLS